jgi:hypothetical protein
MSTHVNHPRRARHVLLTFAAAGAILAGSALPAVAAQDEWTPPPGWSTAPGGANSSGGSGFWGNIIFQAGPPPGRDRNNARPLLVLV